MRNQREGVTAPTRNGTGQSSDRHGIEPETTDTANPLLWLYRRKDRNGQGLIGPAAYAAGERLRADILFAGMLPKTTMDWSASGFVDISRTGKGLNPTEAALAARQRVDLALRAVGPEFSGLLLDLCGFCKGLELIEQERGWPQRSGKIVIQIALATLARHYGLDEFAMGRASSRLRTWSAADARPKMRNTGS